MREKILEMYFEKQMKPVEIAKELQIAQYTVTRILQKDERYTKEKELRKEANRKKHIEKTKEYVKRTRKIKQFKNSADNLILKNMHNQASYELSEPKKLTNIAYRNWNKSAYTYNPKRKGYEFRKELGRTRDVPKFIKVEVKKNG